MRGKYPSGLNGAQKLKRFGQFEPRRGYWQSKDLDGAYGVGERVARVVDGVVDHHASIVNEWNARIDSRVRVAEKLQREWSDLGLHAVRDSDDFAVVII